MQPSGPQSGSGSPAGRTRRDARQAWIVGAHEGHPRRPPAPSPPGGDEQDAVRRLEAGELAVRRRGSCRAGSSARAATPAPSSSSGAIRASRQTNSQTASCVQPSARQKPACSGPSASTPWPPLPVENQVGCVIERAKERRTSSAECVSCWANWCGPLRGADRDGRVLGAGSRAGRCSGSHGAGGGSSAKQSVNLPGWPKDEASDSPGFEPSTFMATSRSARPIVAFARLPGPSALWRAFIPISAAIGPLTTAQSGGAAGARQHRVQVERRVEHRLERGDDDREVLRQAAGHDGVRRRLPHRHATAARRQVADQELGVGRLDDLEHRLDPLGRRRHDRQTVRPPAREELLLDVLLRECQRLAHQNARGSPRSSATRFRTIWFVIGPI